MGPVIPGSHPHSEETPIEAQDVAAQASEGAGDKYTKDEVNYRPAGKSSTRCVFCKNYQPGYGTNSCSRVEGPIKPGDVCDLYSPAGEEPGNPAASQEGGSITDLVGPKGV